MFRLAAELEFGHNIHTVRPWKKLKSLLFGSHTTDTAYIIVGLYRAHIRKL